MKNNYLGEISVERYLLEDSIVTVTDQGDTFVSGFSKAPYHIGNNWLIVIISILLKWTHNIFT